MSKKIVDFKNILDPIIPEYEKFHQLTKTHRISRYKSNKYWPKSIKTVYYKAYERMPEVKLPTPQISEDSLKQTLIQRISKRSFSTKPLSLQKISNLLYYSSGVKKHTQNRFYPSAGKRYPLELYILATNTTVKKGLYHYYVKNNSLEEIITFKNFKFNKHFTDLWVKDAGIIILVTGVFKRTCIKYGSKGYRFTLLEAGHISQNIYLLSSLLNLNCCQIGGFIDDRLHTLIDIDGKEEAILTTIAVGNYERLK